MRVCNNNIINLNIIISMTITIVIVGVIIVIIIVIFIVSAQGLAGFDLLFDISLVL